MCRGICKFPRIRGIHSPLRSAAGGDPFQGPILLHQSIHFSVMECILFQRTCSTRQAVEAKLSRIGAWKIAKFLQKGYEILPRLQPVLTEMASPKRELMMLRVFRLTLPAALLVSLTWITLFTDSARQAVINGLGANANIIVFILGLFLVIGLYWVMGIYERKILYENRHVRPAF